jgi:hypothetical protein
MILEELLLSLKRKAIKNNLIASMVTIETIEYFNSDQKTIGNLVGGFVGGGELNSAILFGQTF